MRALGIDVGVRKGFDLVGLSDDLTPQLMVRHASLEDVEGALQERPEVVAIDSPPAWARAGFRSRETERCISRAGIHCYATPSAERGEINRFYEWMKVGFSVFRLAGAAGYRRYEGGEVGGTAIEVFPHGTAVALAKRLGPPAGTARRWWRRGILADHGVAVAGLRGPDQVDAALAALTGFLALRGRFCAVGDPQEGVIVLPIPSLPERRYTREAA